MIFNMNTKTTIKIGFICILIMLFTGCCVTNVETSITEETFAPISETTSLTSLNNAPEKIISPEHSLIGISEIKRLDMYDEMFYNSQKGEGYYSNTPIASKDKNIILNIHDKSFVPFDEHSLIAIEVDFSTANENFSIGRGGEMLPLYNQKIVKWDFVSDVKEELLSFENTFVYGLELHNNGEFLIYHTTDHSGKTSLAMFDLSDGENKIIHHYGEVFEEAKNAPTIYNDLHLYYISTPNDNANTFGLYCYNIEDESTNFVSDINSYPFIHNGTAAYTDGAQIYSAINSETIGKTENDLYGSVIVCYEGDFIIDYFNGVVYSKERENYVTMKTVQNSSFYGFFGSDGIYTTVYDDIGYHWYVLKYTTERTAFSENNITLDTSDYKEFTFVAGNHKVSVKCPNDWNKVDIVYSDDFPQQHTGLQLFDGEIPEQLEIIDGKIFIASATSGFADGHLKDRYSISDFESFETSKGYKLKIYYGNDDFPEFALFEEYPDMCIFFDIESEEEIAEIVSIVNSIEII